MRYGTLSLLASILVARAAAQVPSNIHFDGIGESSARVIFDVSADYDTVELVYRPTSVGVCTGGAGTVQTNNTFHDSRAYYGMTLQITGLAPNTSYNVCVRAKLGAGSFTYATAVLTTALSGTATPTAPTPVNITFPAIGTTVTAASCSDAQMKINALNPGETVIVPHAFQCTTGWTTPDDPERISFTPSAVKTSDSTITLTAHPYSTNDEVHFYAAGDNTTNCLPGMKIYPGNNFQWGPNCDKGGGISKNGRYYIQKVDANTVRILDAPGGNQVIFGYIKFTAATDDNITFVPTENTPGGYKTAGGSGIAANTVIQVRAGPGGALPTGLFADTDYNIETACTPVTDPNQGGGTARAACVTRLLRLGSPVDIQSTGTAPLYIVDQGLGTMYIDRAPTSSDSWKTIMTDGVISGEGAYNDPAIYNQLFQLTKSDYTATSMIEHGIMAHHWRVIGANFNTAGNTDYLTTTEPRAPCAGPNINQDNRYIIYDRIWIRGGGYPNRLGCRNGAANMFIDGAYVGIISSDLTGLDFWHAWFGGTGGPMDGGMVPSVQSAGTIARLSAGAAHLGVVTVTTSGNSDITITGGTGAGTGVVYFAMNGRLKVILPNGYTATCSSSGTIVPSATYGCDISNAAGATATIPENGTATVPFTGSNQRLGLGLFSITFNSSGVITSVQETGVNASGYTVGHVSQGTIEGSQAMICGNGPGPFIFHNNHVNGSGLTLHCDEGGGPFLNRGDNTITRNTFTVNPVSRLLGAQSDGLWYGNRQPLEGKSGQRWNISGNIFDGCYNQNAHNGVCMVFQARVGGRITDVDISNNWYHGVSGGAVVEAPVQYAPAGIPAARIRFNNNLLQIDGYTYRVPIEAQPYGWVFYGGEATENLQLTHNTIYRNLGSSSQLVRINRTPVGGMKITDNIYSYNGNTTAFVGDSNDNCTAGNSVDEAFAQCAFTSGPGTPSYQLAGNVFVPSYNDPSAPVDNVKISAATASGRFPIHASSNFFPDFSTVSASLADLKWFCTDDASCGSVTANFALKPSSAYHLQGSDGTDPGVNFSQLQSALGRAVAATGKYTGRAQIRGGIR